MGVQGVRVHPSPENHKAIGFHGNTCWGPHENHNATKSVFIGAVLSGSMLMMVLASILKFVSNVRQLLAADDFIRRHCQVHFSALYIRFNTLFTSALKNPRRLGTSPSYQISL